MLTATGPIISETIQFHSLLPRETFSTCGGDPNAISGFVYPEERILVEYAVPQRQTEFRAGRLYARQAMTKLGLKPGPILQDHSKAPTWPQGVVGSISHTQKFCIATLAKRENISSVGIDAERPGPFPLDMLPNICTEDELVWLSTLPRQVQACVATLLFSAKESFYKYQYPLTGRWLDYTEVTIYPEWNANAFTVTHCNLKGYPNNKYSGLTGRYLLLDNLVVTAVFSESKN